MTGLFLRGTPVLGLCAALFLAGCGGDEGDAYPSRPCPQLGGGEASIRGTVVWEERQQPLEDAQVYIEGTRCGMLADSAGRYGLTGLPSGKHTLVFELLGYRTIERPVELEEGQEARIDFRAEMVPVKVLDEPGDSAAGGP